MTATDYAVYSMRDKTGALLYVGATSRGHMRQVEHMATRAWAGDVATTEWEHFSERAAALDRERELIGSEKPRYNVVHSGQRLREMDAATRAQWTETLTTLGERRARLRRDLKALSGEVAAAVQDAHADGMGKSEIARAAQISRPTLDAILKAAKVP